MVLGGEDGAGSPGGRGGQSWRWRGGRRHTVRPCSAADPAGPGSSLLSAAARGSDHSCLGRRAGVEVSCSAPGFARCRPPSHYLGRFSHTCDLLAAPAVSGPAPGRPLSLAAQCCASLFHVWPAGAQPRSETWLFFFRVFCALSLIAAFIPQGGCGSQAALGPSVRTARDLGASRLPCELRPA